MYKGATHDNLMKKGSKMPSKKPEPTQDSQPAHPLPAREAGTGSSPGTTRHAPEIDLESIHPLQRARLNAAVLMLVDYLVSASMEA
jgi:hypothetical protein